MRHPPERLFQVKNRLIVIVYSRRRRSYGRLLRAVHDLPAGDHVQEHAHGKCQKLWHGKVENAAPGKIPS